MNDNVLVSTIKDNLQIHFNITTSKIKSIYNNSELWNDTILKLCKIKNNNELIVECDESNK